MKRQFTLIGLLGLALTASGAAAEPMRLGVEVVARPYMVARLELAQDRRRGGDDDRARNAGLDQAIKMVLRRTGGSYVSAEAIGDDTYRVVVRIGNRIVAYRVNMRSGSMDEE